MAVLFVHDHKFKVDPVGNVYSEGKITDSVFRRYTYLSSEVIVFARAISVGDVAGLNKISANFVRFNFVRGVPFSAVLGRFLFFNIFSIFRCVRAANCCVVRLPSVLGVFCWVFCLVTRKPYFVEVVGDARESLTYAIGNRSLLKRLLIWLMEVSTRLGVRFCSGAIYVTRFYLQNIYPTKSLTAFASNVEVDYPKENRYLRVQAWPSDRSFVIGTIGSFFNPSKGFAVAIDAIDHLRRRGLNVELRILGDGIRTDYLRMAAELGVSSHVFFDGTLPGGRAVLEWLGNLDAYIQPSLGGEGLPRALIEAMAMGVPAIGTNISGLPEVLREDFTVEPGDSLALSQKLEAVIRDLDLRNELSSWSYEIAGNYSRDLLSETRAKFWSSAAEMLDKNI